MTVKATPWKSEKGKFQVCIRFRWPDMSVCRDRKVIDARSVKDAERWGVQRESELRASGKPKEPAAVLSGESVRDWFKRYYDEAEAGRVGRKNRGKAQVSVKERRGRFKNHIEDLIGDKAMVAVTANDLRAIVEKLDDQVRVRVLFYEAGDGDEREGAKPGMSSKSAAHVWSEITSGFREACGSKLASLRIAGMVDPTIGVFPPMRTEQRQQAALYSSELVKLLACETVPLARRPEVRDGRVPRDSVLRAGRPRCVVDRL